MPQYPYRDKLSGYQLDLYRPFGQNNKMPEDSELPEKEQGKKRDWERLIATNIKTTKSNNWGPGKGNW
jgi:hypothetical protein